MLEVPAGQVRQARAGSGQLSDQSGVSYALARRSGTMNCTSASRAEEDFKKNSRGFTTGRQKEWQLADKAWRNAGKKEMAGSK